MWGLTVRATLSQHKCCYTLSVWLSILAHPYPVSGIASSAKWLANITEQFGKVVYVISGQSDMETDSSSRYGFIWIRFQVTYLLLFRKVCEFHLQTGCYQPYGTGIRLEGEKVLPHHPKIIATYAFVIVQILHFSDWTCSAWWWGVQGSGRDETEDRQLCSHMAFDDNEFASNLVLCDVAATVSH